MSRRRELRKLWSKLGYPPKILDDAIKRAEGKDANDKIAEKEEDSNKAIQEAVAKYTKSELNKLHVGEIDKIYEEIFNETPSKDLNKKEKIDLILEHQEKEKEE